MPSTAFPARHWSETLLGRVLGPMQEFMHRSAAGGIILVVVTVIALVLANSPLAPVYDAVLHTKVSFAVGPFALSESVLHWVNDGLMAIFFFLVGLEIKREVLVGELADVRAALLPIGAAVGGALAPAVIYLALNWGRSGAAGWGVPMATDIAFSLGVLALLGDRVPYGLKVFLTALAIIDDLIAVLVIALFYAGGIAWPALATGLGLLGLLGLANIFGIRALLVYAGLGSLVWLAFLQSGVHATVAGVLVALTVPARSRLDPAGFLTRARGILDRFEAAGGASTPMLTDERQQTALLELEDAAEAAQAPLQKVEHALHAWVQFGVMPIFALTNAGVALALGTVSGEAVPVALGIALGLVVGKPVGILLAAWLLVRSGLAGLPAGVSWSQLAGVACLAGIGFTMSLFIATLGFGQGALLEGAKLGILGASLVAGGLGYLVLWRQAPAPVVEPGAAPAAHH